MFLSQMMELFSQMAFSKACPVDMCYKTALAVIVILTGNITQEQKPQVDHRLQDIKICFPWNYLLWQKHLGVQNWDQKIDVATVKQKEQLAKKKNVFQRFSWIFVLKKPIA